MKKKINISKIVLLRLAILFLVFVAAVVFDLSHDDVTELKTISHENTASPNLDMGHVYFYNPANSFKLLDRGDKLLSHKLFSASQDKFLTRYHNNRAFYILKKESDKDRLPFFLMAHFMKFTSVQYSSPDDYPLYS